MDSQADQDYRTACEKAIDGDAGAANRLYRSIRQNEGASSALRALVENDLGSLAAVTGQLPTALEHYEAALRLDNGCAAARRNLALLDTRQPVTAATRHASTTAVRRIPPLSIDGGMPAVRVAILSLLFNWPSTGGGTVHTSETGKFLKGAGYDVKHFYAHYAEWGVGNVTLPLDHPSERLTFADREWNAPEIQRRFREAVDRFAPDYVIITDSWNFKPLLAEAMSGYKYYLRLAAQECLCPLNNVRLLVDDQGRFSACPRNQLATAVHCRQCVSARQHQSGSLHQAERALSGYGTAAYDEKLRTALADAEGILAVNPLIAAAVAPYSKAVHVVPSGFDPIRFPWPWPDEEESQPKSKATIFFAGLIAECMKGFRVLHSACAKLWQERQDFELVATSDPVGQFDPMTRFVGWLPQDELPRQVRQATFLVFPTIAEEALGRSAVEAMGVGRPVIASRIGGLPFTVSEGLTGLLFQPGNADDLADKIETLLDDPGLRARMGEAARKRFEEHFTWNVVIEQHYRRLLAPLHT